MHYQRLRAHGSATWEPPTLEQRFWSKVRKGPDCWEWTASRCPYGYGKFGSTHRAHRWAWTFANGPVPPGLWVLHRCDNPPCVRPDHLFLGSHADNMADMMAKGRSIGQHKGLPGEANPAAKLTAGDVTEIRHRAALGVPGKVMAREFGVTPTLIRFIVKRRVWKGLP